MKAKVVRQQMKTTGSVGYDAARWNGASNPACKIPKDEALLAFIKRMDDKEFERAVTYGPNTPKEVRKRLEIAAAMMKEAFDAA